MNFPISTILITISILAAIYSIYWFGKGQEWIDSHFKGDLFNQPAQLPSNYTTNVGIGLFITVVFLITALVIKDFHISIIKK